MAAGDSGGSVDSSLSEANESEGCADSVVGNGGSVEKLGIGGNGGIGGNDGKVAASLFASGVIELGAAAA